MYAHETDFTMIEREALEAKVMVEDILELYGFETGGEYLSNEHLRKIKYEKKRISWKLNIIVDALARIEDTIKRVDSTEGNTAKADKNA